MNSVYSLDIHKENKELGTLVDPCSECRDKPYCKTTCKKADDWWAQFAKKFNRTTIVRKLGGE